MNDQEKAIPNYQQGLGAQRSQQQLAPSNFIIPVVVYVVHNERYNVIVPETAPNLIRTVRGPSDTQDK